MAPGTSQWGLFSNFGKKLFYSQLLAGKPIMRNTTVLEGLCGQESQNPKSDGENMFINAS